MRRAVGEMHPTPKGGHLDTSRKLPELSRVPLAAANAGPEVLLF